MLIRCYSIYDRKTLSYHPPYFAPTDGAAVRTLSDAMQEGGTTFARHPADYVLYYVGTFDDQDAQMIPMLPVRQVVELLALVPSAAPLPLDPQPVEVDGAMSTALLNGGLV